jgi:hypothetical protein
MLLAVLVAATAIGVTACGSASSRNTSHTKTTASTNYGLAALSLMFPRNGQDIAAGAALEDFEIGVGTKRETQCLSAADLPGPPSRPLPQLQYGTAQLPNMPVIERADSLGLTTVVAAPSDPAAKLLPAERRAYAAQLRRCTVKAEMLFDVLRTPTAEGLFDEWANIVDETEVSHAVQVANAKASACSDKTSFPATSVENEVAAISAKLPRLVESGQEAKANAVQGAGVRVLVKCFGPSIALVSKLLTARRQQFFENNAQAIRAVQAGTDKAVAGLYRAGYSAQTASKPERS